MKIDDTRRLGNLLFNYASLLGIAHRNNYTAVIGKDSLLHDYFHLGMLTRRNSTFFNSKVIVNSDYAYEYDKRTENLEESWNRGLFPSFHNSFTSLFQRTLVYLYEYALVGYFQAFNYFSNVEHDLRRKHLQFKKHVTSQADLFFEEEVINIETESKKKTIY